MTMLHELLEFRPVVYTGNPRVHRWSDLFGIELELEDPTVVQNTTYWQCKDDGSLRNGVEYVMRAPQGADELQNAIDEFYKLKCKFTNGPRTSTHIHITAGDLSLDNLRVMCALLYVIEDGLYNVIGESRKWAGYSMPLSEMEPRRLKEVMNATDQRTLSNAISPQQNRERYYGFNMCAQRHGTLEFRYFPGGPTQEELSSWLDLLMQIKAAAKRYTLDNVLEFNDEDQLIAWLRTIFDAQWFAKLTAAATARSMYERYLEIAAFCVDPGELNRNQLLIFATRGYVNFINKNLLGSAGGELLTKQVTALPIMALSDFSQAFLDALDADFKSSRKKKKVDPVDVGVGVPAWAMPPPLAFEDGEARDPLYVNADVARIVRAARDNQRGRRARVDAQRAAPAVPPRPDQWMVADEYTPLLQRNEPNF